MAEDLTKSLAEGFGEGVAGTLAVGTIAGVSVILTQIDGGNDTGHEDGAGYGAEPMVVDLIGEARIAGAVGSGHGANVERLPVGEDQTLPGHENPLLPIANVAGVCADKPGSLGDEKEASCGRVVDVLADLGHDLTGEIRVDAGDHNGGEDETGADHVGGSGSFHL